MRIGIFGSTGFIGKYLALSLSTNNQVVGFTREDLSMVGSGLANKIIDLDVIINLVGSPILDKRWTKSYKKIIISSRLEAINKIKQALILAGGKAPIFICASAVGIYKTNIYCDEFDFKYQNDFVSDVVRAWELAAMSLEALVSKSIIIRLGIVLGKESGMLKQLIKIYELGLGGVVGKKDSYFSYITLNDLVRGILFLIKHKESNGVYNFTEPVTVTNIKFAHALADSLNTKARFNIPSWALKIAMGERADVIVAGQLVFPKKLLNLGFEFNDSDIAAFLNLEIKKKLSGQN